jgi:hypothetical protein
VKLVGRVVDDARIIWEEIINRGNMDFSEVLILACSDPRIVNGRLLCPSGCQADKDQADAKHAGLNRHFSEARLAPGGVQDGPGKFRFGDFQFLDQDGQGQQNSL